MEIEAGKRIIVRAPHTRKCMALFSIACGSLPNGWKKKRHHGNLALKNRLQTEKPGSSWKKTVRLYYPTGIISNILIYIPSWRKYRLDRHSMTFCKTQLKIRNKTLLDVRTFLLSDRQAVKIDSFSGKKTFLNANHFTVYAWSNWHPHAQGQKARAEGRMRTFDQWKKYRNQIPGKR